MTTQDAVNAIAERLNKLRATDPKYQAAWESIVLLHPDCLVLKQLECDVLFKRVDGNCHGTGYAPLQVWRLPDGAVRGLLEEVMEKTCGIQRFRWPDNNVEMLAEVVMEELDARLEALNEQP